MHNLLMMYLSLDLSSFVLFAAKLDNRH